MSWSKALGNFKYSSDKRKDNRIIFIYLHIRSNVNLFRMDIVTANPKGGTTPRPAFPATRNEMHSIVECDANNLVGHVSKCLAIAKQRKHLNRLYAFPWVSLI